MNAQSATENPACTRRKLGRLDRPLSPGYRFALAADFELRAA
jgi:hypothetical protein